MASSVQSRLKQVCESYFGGNKAKLAKTLGVGYQNVNNYIEKGKTPSFEMMQKLYAHFKGKINPEWLFLGEGEMDLDLRFQNSNMQQSDTALTQQLLEHQILIIDLQQRLIKQLDK